MLPVVATLLLEHLRALGLTWPVADFDSDAEKARVAASPMLTW